MNDINGVGQLLVISSSNFCDSRLAIQPHSDSLIGLDELVELLGKLFVLHCDNSDVVVE